MRWSGAHEGWPVVGRDDALAVASGVLSDRDQQGVAVVGPAGVGRTRFGDEVARQVTGEVLYVPATRSAASIPFGAFAALLPSDGLGDGEPYVRLRRAVDSILDRAGADERTVVYVDDAHLLDEASAALVLQLSLSERVSLLLTLRPDEPQPDALVDLWKDSLTRIELSPLDVDATAAMAAAILGAPLDRVGAQALHRAGGGVPLVTRELVTGLRSEGRLTERDGIWLLPGSIEVPPRLAELTEHRLSGLSPDARFVLEMVAMSEPLGRALVVKLDLLGALGELERAHLVREARDDRRVELRLTHPLHREVARSGLGADRRVSLLRELIHWLHSTGARRRLDPSLIAAWSVEAGEPADPAALLALAADAGAGGDLESMARFARLAGLSGGGAYAGYVHGLALDGLGRHEDAESVFADAEPLATTPEDRVRLAAARADNLFRGLGRADDAVAILAAAGDAATAPLVRAQAGVLALFDLRFDDALAAAEPVLEVDDDVVRSVAALPVAMVNEQRGLFLRAEEVAVRGLESLRRVPPSVRATDEATSATAVARARSGLGDVAGARSVLEPVLIRAVDSGDRHGQAWASIGLAGVALLEGRWRRGEELAREAAAVFATLDHPFVAAATAMRVEALSMSGEVSAVADAVRTLGGFDRSAVRMSDLDIARARGWGLVALGDRPAGVAAVAAVAGSARDDRRFGIEARALHDLVRLGVTDPEVITRLHALGEELDGGLVRMRAEHGAATAAADGARLDSVAQGFASTGLLLYAAEASNEAAISHRASGDPRLAAASTRRSRAWASVCGDPCTPMLLHGMAAAVLTRREREVADLAATGRSSRQIADELFLSPRTVDNHLQRVYDKLGISGRAELADALAAAGA